MGERKGLIWFKFGLVVWCLLGAARMMAAGLPNYFVLPSGATLASMEADEAYGEAAFTLPGKDANVDNVQRGHHWVASLTLGGVPEEMTGKVMWSRFKQALQKAGWSVAAEFDENPFSATLRLTQPGRVAWASLVLFSPGDIRLHVVEVGSSKLQLKLATPADKPEVVKPGDGNFPFLAPLPQAKFESGARNDQAFLVTLPGQTEPSIVATSSITKHYATPESISNAEFSELYRKALKEAGWSIVVDAQGLHQSDALLIAHYARGGRDIWAELHYGPGAQTLRVADAGQQDMAQAMRKDCRVTLTGVFFDFDKATIKPESESVLGRARDALKANVGQLFEVQGHTDAVGQDAYNVKLSQSRAESVQAWFVGHGISTTQLSAKGYGKTRPVASNDSDDGRARNRRVELVCRK